MFVPSVNGCNGREVDSKKHTGWREGLLGTYLTQTSIKWVGINHAYPSILGLTAEKQINSALPRRRHITSE